MKVKRTSANKYVVDALDRALDVLEGFKDSEEVSLRDMSTRTGLNKSRTFRLLYTLSERGYVERTVDGQRYKLGLKLFEHATKFRRDLKRIAQPFMRQLHARFNETINLAVLHNGDVLYVELLESSRPFRMAAMIGSRMPIHSTALGMAMLAHSPEHEIAAFLQQLTGPHSRKLKKELATVRQRGYALDHQANEPGVACVGAPIFDLTASAIAAMSLSGPVGRVLKQEKEIGATLMGFCREISRYMGFVGGPAGQTRGGSQASLRVEGSA
jgi:DNA-binding IclR family transcriptional regulator